MKIDVIPAASLTDDQAAAWRRLQEANPSCASPHFCVEFARAVAAIRDRVEVAVLSERDTITGFLPFLRDRRNVGQRLAGNFSDLQGMVGWPDDSWDAREIIRQCGLAAYRFHYQIASQRCFQPYSWRRCRAAYMDLSQGFEAYRDERRRAGSDELREALRKSRKLARDVAPLRFVPQSDDAAAFATLIDWKRAQLKSRRLDDCFREPWVLPLLEAIVARRSGDFQGMLSVLYVGDEIAAISLGMRWRHVMHGWITAFNRDYARYSPGMLLVAHLAQAVPELGVRRIDMGAGREPFKCSFASGLTEVAAGAVDLRPMARTAYCGWMLAKDLIRDTTWDGPARRVLRAFRQAGSYFRAAAR